MDENVKRWTAKRKTVLVNEIIQGKTTVAEAGQSFALSPSEIEGWVESLMVELEQAQQRITSELNFLHKGRAAIRLPETKKGPVVPRDLLEEQITMSAKHGAFVLSQIGPDVTQTIGYARDTQSYIEMLVSL